MNVIMCLQEDFPDFTFKIGDENLWLPDRKTIVYRPQDEIGLLHELGHALCGHTSFTQDIELIHSERDAWDKAIELCEKYGVKISEDRIEEAMDWYRDWLHQRSTCPNCNQNGIQNRENSDYSCVNCNTSWLANDSRRVSLRRNTTK